MLSLGGKEILCAKAGTVRPRGTRPHETRTSLGHDFKKGSKIFEISDFGTQTSLGHDFKNHITTSLIN